MIGIQPFPLGQRQLLTHQATGIDRAKGEGFEAQELAKLALARLLAQYQGFNSYTPTARTVSRWACSNRARF